MKKTSSVIYLLFLILFLLAGCERSSSDWIKYNTDIDGNVHSYKMDNYEEDGKISVQVWRKTVLSEKGKKKEIQFLTNNGVSTKGFDKLSEIQSTNEIDCEKKMGHLVNVSYYDTNHHILYAENNNNGTEYVIPNTNDENLLKIICQ